jgi:hypothetical protein
MYRPTATSNGAHTLHTCPDLQMVIPTSDKAWSGTTGVTAICVLKGSSARHVQVKGPCRHKTRGRARVDTTPQHLCAHP